MAIMYRLRITDAPGQPSRTIDGDDDRDLACREAHRLAAAGFIGGTVDVIDSTIEHPDHNIVASYRRVTSARVEAT